MNVVAPLMALGMLGGFSGIDDSSLYPTHRDGYGGGNRGTKATKSRAKTKTARRARNRASRKARRESR